ncbi:hypothetical protein BASA81_000080 [Batrachochytrium salamandrivorans]|nr:hypothetical protein BASA81_000080 [Batrachochytrium salamandrivorans]
MSAAPSVVSPPASPSPSSYLLDDAPPPTESNNNEKEEDELATVPAKRTRYDKLGREVEEDIGTAAAVSVAKPPPLSTATTKATSAKSAILKRPRGRTPKGMVWDDKRGFVTEGLRSFKL